jgi:hypothetical protein
MTTPADLLAAVRGAFSSSTRPELFTVKSSEYEVVRAESIFASRKPETLQSTDVGIGAGWPEVYLNQQAQNYYMPGFVRLILEADEDTGFEADDFLSHPLAFTNPNMGSTTESRDCECARFHSRTIV